MIAMPDILPKVFIEENGVYCIDCTKAVWATNEIHNVYQKSGTILKDVDFVIETNEYMLLVEYKNALIPGAIKPDAFDLSDKRIANTVIRKYYDSLHYLRLLQKEKPVKYIYVVECEHGTPHTRKLLRRYLQRILPFKLQDSLDQKNVLIANVQVMSIDEWNQDSTYQNYPIVPLSLLEAAE